MLHEVNFLSYNKRDQVQGWIYVPAARPKGIVQIIHGFGEHSRRYLHMIVKFMDAGYIVAADDHVGHGKTAMVIGRDVKENQVDIDLGQSAYASMVDIEHAVLNYSAGDWYVEDLGSTNGISVKKAGDGRVYKLSRDTPCRLERGDCLYIGLNRLLLK